MLTEAVLLRLGVDFGVAGLGEADDVTGNGTAAPGLATTLAACSFLVPPGEFHCRSAWWIEIAVESQPTAKVHI